MKKILDVFNTATDAYLEYVNNFLTKEKFTEFFDLEEEEVDNLFYAAQETKENELSWVCLDYYVPQRSERKRKITRRYSKSG